MFFCSLPFEAMSFALLDAVRANDEWRVRSLLRESHHRATINNVGASASQMRRFDRETPLFAAVRRRQGSMVQLLIDNGASVALTDLGELESTPLHRAFEDSSVDLQIVAILIGAGSNLRAVDHNGRSALTLALTSQCDRVAVERLLLAGADPNQICGGSQALHVAAFDEWPLLLAAGADPSAWTTNKKGKHQSPMLRAIESDDCDVAMLLLAAGASAPTADMLLDRDPAGKWARLHDDHTAIHAARAKIHSVGLEVICGRVFDICVALQDLQLPALCTVEILLVACAPFANNLPFHFLWQIVTRVKHSN